MNWIGKVTLGALGLAIRGPVGAVVGVLAGAVVDSAPQALRALFPEPTVDDEHVASYALLGKMAAADGEVNQDELKAFVSYLDKIGTEGDARGDAAVIFKVSGNSVWSLEELAISFFRLVSYDDEKLAQMVVDMLDMAVADGPVNLAEDQVAGRVAKIFLFSQERYSAIRSQYKTATGSRSSRRPPKGSMAEKYNILGALESDSDETIKKQYRKLASEFHPDKIASKNLPEEFTEFANTKLAQINEAYDTIRKSRGMS